MAFLLLATFLPFPIAVLEEEKVVWLAGLALALISSFSENFRVARAIFIWVGQNFSE